MGLLSVFVFLPAPGNWSAHLVSLHRHHHIQTSVGAFLFVDLDGFGDGYFSWSVICIGFLPLELFFRNLRATRRGRELVGVISQIWLCHTSASSSTSTGWLVPLSDHCSGSSAPFRFWGCSYGAVILLNTDSKILYINNPRVGTGFQLSIQYFGGMRLYHSDELLS